MQLPGTEHLEHSKLTRARHSAWHQFAAQPGIICNCSNRVQASVSWPLIVERVTCCYLSPATLASAVGDSETCSKALNMFMSFQPIPSNVQSCCHGLIIEKCCKHFSVEFSIEKHLTHLIS